MIYDDGGIMMKKLYISADIEGTCGITAWEETDAGGRNYDYFCGQMTREVAAAVQGAEKAGYISTVKDAHDSARNIDPMGLPTSASLIRGWTRDLYCMMGGLDKDAFDAVAFTGYHANAMSEGNPLSHTMTRDAYKVLINGEPASEFRINAYIAAYLNIPVVFLSGDAAVCQEAKALIPHITTVVAKEGIGNAVLSKHPEVVCSEIQTAMQTALSGDISACKVYLPPYFEIEVSYADWTVAQRYAYYPDVVRVDNKTISYATHDYYEALRFMHFCL